MGKKRKDKRGVSLKFIGSNATGVTGSSIYGETDDGFKFLLELGGVQEGTVLNNYNKNLQLINQIDFEGLDVIFIAHGHIDHSMLVPVATSKGFAGKIITTHETSQLLLPLWEDCAFILEGESVVLSKKKGYVVHPFYTKSDVEKTLNYVCSYSVDEEHKLTDNVRFKFLRNNHILGSIQLELWYRDKASHEHKLLYTSDLGNPVVPKHYVDKIEYCQTANVAIFESTYGKKSRTVTKKDREEDLKLLKRTVEHTILEKGGNLIIPSFSLDRSQNLITVLYDMFYDDERFNNIQFVLDGRLTNRITNVYKNVLEGEDKKKFDRVLNWSNLKIIYDFKDTEACCSDPLPKVILSSSGFGDKGHIVYYLTNSVSNEKNTILFAGYSSPTSLSSRLQEPDKKYIRINGINYKLKCEVVRLRTFSSHMQHKELIDYMKQINVSDRIILVHGDKDGRQELLEDAKEELSKCNKTTKIIDSMKDMVIDY